VRRGVTGLLVHRDADHLGHLPLSEPRLAAPALGDHADAAQPVPGESRSPRAYRVCAHPHPSADLLVGQAVSGSQQSLGLADRPIGHRGRGRDRVQLFRLNSADQQWQGATSDRLAAILDPCHLRYTAIVTDDERLIVETAKARPERVGVPFTHWSKRELRDHLADNRVRKVEVSKERLRQVLDVNGVTVQRAKPGRCPTTPAKRRGSTASRR